MYSIRNPYTIIAGTSTQIKGVCLDKVHQEVPGLNKNKYKRTGIPH